MIIGITGGTGSGKTTLLKCIERCGGLILDCDAIYHHLLQTDKNLLDAINARFPGVVEAGTLQRKKLGNIVFSDEQALKDLNAITHSAIKTEVAQQLVHHQGLAAIDAIALFESGLSELCHTTVAILAPKEDRVQRLMYRDNISKEYAQKRIDAQHNDAWFQDRCDHVLSNCGNAEEFQAKCVAFLQSFGIMEPSN